MGKKNIALVTGGYTGEYVISVASAKVAEKHIDTSNTRSIKSRLTAKNGCMKHPMAMRLRLTALILR